MGYPKAKQFAPDLPKMCAFCRHYEIHTDRRGAFCLFWEKSFPEQTEWVRNSEVKKPGERSCRNWDDKKI